MRLRGVPSSMLKSHVNRSSSPRTVEQPAEGHFVSRARVGLGVLGLLLISTGCVTQGDFLRLQEKIADQEQAKRNAPDPFARIAQLSSDVDSLSLEIRDLQGELELARKEASDALTEVRRTRSMIAEGGIEGSRLATSGSISNANGSSSSASARQPLAGEPKSSPDQELTGYQTAHDAWRKDNFTHCIDLFTTFLQNYPTSGYADDAAYWLADCTYKNDEFKRAVVRFNAVVSVYPESPKAPDALYRQGESLLKLGPKFNEAARTVFKRVQKDYPNSKRAGEAERQLERLGPSG
jgi:tol-pal system protein YbgF